MGCDIHLYFEEKDHTGKWKEVLVTPDNILPDGRNYPLWAFLFNVRNDLQCRFRQHPFASRGLPEDCSIKYIKENICVDIHSLTYIYANEVDSIEWPEDFEDCYFKIFLEYVFPEISSTYQPLENHRMIIWFDN